MPEDTHPDPAPSTPAEPDSLGQDESSPLARGETTPQGASSPPARGETTPQGASSPPARGIDVDIVAEDARWEAHDLEDDIAQAIRAALSDRVGEGLVTVLLSDDASQRALNAAHRGIDKSTDVLSFPAHPQAAEMAAEVGEPVPLGDIALAYETVVRDADDEGVSLRDHTLHLIVHGTLHLAGETHDGTDDAAAMETAETRILATLGIADPYG